MFQQVAKQEVDSRGWRRRVFTQGHGLVTESGCCCPTGLPTSNARHNPNGREKKDPSFTQLSSMPVESQMEEMTTRCPALAPGVWHGLGGGAYMGRRVTSLPFDVCLSRRLALPSRGREACNSATGHQEVERLSGDPDNPKVPREVLLSMGCQTHFSGSVKPFQAKCSDGKGRRGHLYK